MLGSAGVTQLDGAKLVTMFKEFDADGNGVLTPSECSDSPLRSLVCSLDACCSRHEWNVHVSVEFGESLARIGIKLKRKEFDMLIADLDKNGDGMIEFSEFAGGVMDHHSKEMKGTKQKASRALL